MPPRQIKKVGKAHRFGGSWTTAKLDVIAQYLHGHTTALKDKPSEERPFRKAYIDAFVARLLAEIVANDRMKREYDFIATHLHL
jgi:hypothetical protein